MLQELPVKFCAGATFITGFNGSGYSDLMNPLMIFIKIIKLR